MNMEILIVSQIYCTLIFISLIRKKENKSKFYYLQNYYLQFTSSVSAPFSDVSFLISISITLIVSTLRTLNIHNDF